MYERRQENKFYLEGKPTSAGLIRLLVDNGLVPTNNAAIDVKKAIPLMLNDLEVKDSPRAVFMRTQQSWKNQGDL